MAKIDLKDAYFMVPMVEEGRKYLRFQWEGKVYQFNCLPFGLLSGPWFFTKATRAVVAILRELGLCMIIYRDILIVAETESLLKDHMHNGSGLSAGKPGGCPQLTPTQEIKFLEFVVKSTTMELIQDYSTPVIFTGKTREELERWKNHFSQWNGKSLISHSSTLTIETDALEIRWGAVCNGVRTGGPWRSFLGRR